jgi:hypothetical protein
MNLNERLALARARAAVNVRFWVLSDLGALCCLESLLRSNP